MSLTRLRITNSKYLYKRKLLGLKELAWYIQFDPLHNIFESAAVYTKKHRIPLKLVQHCGNNDEYSTRYFHNAVLVFVRNRNKPYEYIVLLSTDCILPDYEIVRRYRNRMLKMHLSGDFTP